MNTAVDINARGAPPGEGDAMEVTVSEDFHALTPPQVEGLIVGSDMDAAVRAADHALAPHADQDPDSVLGVVVYALEENASFSEYQIRLAGKSFTMKATLPALAQMGLLTTNHTATKEVCFDKIDFPRTKSYTPWATHREMGISADGVTWNPKVEARYLFRWRVVTSTGSCRVARFRLAMEVLVVPLTALPRDAMKGQAPAIVDSSDAPVFRLWTSKAHIRWIQVSQRWLRGRFDLHCCRTPLRPWRTPACRWYHG